MPLSAEQVAKMLEAGMSPRAKRLDLYQRYVKGTCYEGRPAFLDESCEKPLSERAPCVQYLAPRNAIEAITTMCLGDGRFPALSSATSEDDSAFDDRFGLSEEDSKTLDTGLLKIREQARLEAKAEKVLGDAMGCGTVAVLLGVVAGQLSIRTIDAKFCEVEFDSQVPTRVTKLTEKYRFTKDEQNPLNAQWETHVYQYKRVIDDQRDVTFKPVEILRDADAPDPSEPQAEYKHKFGFCPVIWYRYNESDASVADVDGHPIHEGLLSQIDAVNFALSQRHRAALYCGDPQIAEIGVDDEDVRVPMGAVGGDGARNEFAHDLHLRGREAGWTGLGPKRAGAMSKRKKGAGTVWRYASPDADVKVLSLGGDALKVLVDDADDNIKRLRESLGFVYVSPEDITGSGDISGKTLEVTYRPQIQVCNRVREEFWRLCLLPMISMLLRIVLKTEKGLYLAGADKIRKIVARFEQEVEGGKTLWFDPSLKATWGDYFEPSDQDESTRITNAGTALEKKLITKATAVAHIKPIFSDIQDVNQYVKALEQEEQEAQAKLHAAMTALNGGDPNDPNAGATPPQGDRDKPSGDSGSGGGGVPSAPAAPAAKAAPAAPAAKAGAAAPAAKPTAPAKAAKSAPKQKVTGKAKPATAPKATQATATDGGKLTTVGADGATHELFGETDHMRGSDESPGIAETVYRDLKEDYSEKQLVWVRHADWRGPLVVPISSIDWTKQFEWPANEDEEHIDEFVQRIESDGYVKPIILVNEPNNSKLVIADGHHRALAYKKLGQNPMAYVAKVGAVVQDGGDTDWRVMHDSQRGGSDQIKK